MFYFKCAFTKVLPVLASSILLTCLGQAQSFQILPSDPYLNPQYITQMSGNGNTFTGYGYSTAHEYYIYSQSQGYYFYLPSSLPPFNLSEDGSTFLVFNDSNYTTQIYKNYAYSHTLSLQVSTGPLSANGGICFPFSFAGSLKSYQVILGATSVADVYTLIPAPAGVDSYVVKTCSADGSIAYGYFQDVSGNQNHAFTWSAATGTRVIGSFFPFSSSDDGSLCVGQNADGTGTPVVWNNSSAQLGQVFPGYTRVFGVAVTPDGKYFYGQYQNSDESMHGLVQTVSSGAIADLGQTGMPIGSDSRFYAAGAFYQPGVGTYQLSDLLNSYNLGSSGLSGYAVQKLTNDGTGMLGTANTSTGSSIWYATLPLEGAASVSPASRVVHGTNFELTVNGSGFSSGTTVYWNGAALPTTTIKPCHIEAEVSRADLADAGNALVTVKFADGSVSAPLNFNVFNLNPTPTTNSTNPTMVHHGGAGFSITVNGTGFLATSTVKWGGLGLVTQYISPVELTANVPAAYYTIGKTVPVTVVNPVPGGGTSNATNVIVQ